MEFWQYLVIFVVGFICLDLELGRICKCVEFCAVARAQGKIGEADGDGIVTQAIGFQVESTEEDDDKDG